MEVERNRWRFPQSDYGEVKGINDAGVETFRSDTLKSLVRETIQNSLDASATDDPVVVEFRNYEIRPEEIPGVDSLRKAMLLCAFEAERQGTEDARDFFRNALEVGSRETVRVMLVSDHGTTGLRGADTCEPGKDWSRLIKENGSSSKGGSSGGSFGIGKNSTFACSDLRTIYVSSMDDGGIESHIGVSRLMSFRPEGSDKYTMGVGYYSGSDRNVAIRSQLNAVGVEARRRDDPGTDILIIGFKCEGDMTREIIKQALVHFLVSIWKGKLAVKVNGVTVNESNLGSHISMLNSHDDDKLVRETIEHYDMLTSTDDQSVRIIEFDPEELRRKGRTYQFAWEKGDCILFLKRGGSNLNRRVMYTRAAGMRLFNQKKISGNINFTGILMIEGEKMNLDFKEMEAPSHDEWAPERASDPKKASKMVTMLKGWVIDKVVECFSKRIDDQIEAYGTALYLPKRNPEKDGGSEERDESLEHSVSEVRQRDLTPKRGERKAALQTDDLTPDQDGEAILHGSGSKRGSKARRGKPGGDLSGFVYVPVKERLVCTDRSTGEYRLTFTVPHSAKQVRILVSTFGEQGADEIEIKSARGGAGAGNEVSHKGNELLLTSVEKDASATVTFVTGFPHYCMMGADYYEAN